MPRIIIIGTEGTGKTVFVTALAKYLESQPEEQVFLDPQNVVTQQYVDETWERLQSGEKVSHSMRGALPELHWKLRFARGKPADVCLIDPAGHAVRGLFASSRSGGAEVDQHLQPLQQACGDANIVLVLVDLQNYLGVSRRSHANANELVLKFALDFLAGDSARRCALIFTKIDLYREEVSAAGSWTEVAKRHLPKVFGAHLANDAIPIFGVTAINKTRVVHDQEQSFLAPAPGFRSEGFDDVVSWLRTNIEDLHWQEELRVLLNALGTRVCQMAKVVANMTYLGGTARLWIAGLAIAGVIAVAVWQGPPDPPLPAKGPRPIASRTYTLRRVDTRTWPWEEHDIDFEVEIDVRNDGDPGFIGIKATVPYGGGHFNQHANAFFGPGEIKTLRVHIDTGPYGSGETDGEPSVIVYAE